MQECEHTTRPLLVSELHRPIRPNHQLLAAAGITFHHGTGTHSLLTHAYVTKLGLTTKGDFSDLGTPNLMPFLSAHPRIIRVHFAHAATRLVPFDHALLRIIFAATRQSILGSIEPTASAHLGGLGALE